MLANQEALELAKNQASRIVEIANNQAQSIYTKAQQNGYDHGRQEFVSLILQGQKNLEQQLKQLEAQTIELAIHIASKIVRKQAEYDPELVHAALRDAMSQLRNAQSIIVRVHPSDEGSVKEKLLATTQACNYEGTIQTLADDQISQGGCILESSIGKVDAQLETQLDLIRRALTSEDAS